MDPAPIPPLAVHLEAAERFSRTLQEHRCLPSGRFEHRAQDPVTVLAPLLQAWVPELLLVLHVHGAARFNRLKGRLDSISARVLTDKLRHLEKNDLVERQAADDGHVYGLTEHGRTTAILLHPLLHYLRTR